MSRAEFGHTGHSEMVRKFKLEAVEEREGKCEQA